VVGETAGRREGGIGLPVARLEVAITVDAEIAVGVQKLAEGAGARRRRRISATLG
jgi:hypothetical protein